VADSVELPTGTVTLLLADVEGSTRLWETQPDVMTAAVARLDQTLSEACAKHGGVRPVEQGEGDSFVIAFSRGADAVACALDLQRAPLVPIKLRIGIHTGDVRLRDEGNYIGPTINRTARLRDLAHGGQTVLSGVTESLVLDQLPPDVTLTELGTHSLRDLPRPERVIQLCHPELAADFPPLRVVNTVAAHHLPAQLTSFVGRRAELTEVRQLVADNRLVTLAGAGGVGKTRLALQVATEMVDEFDGGVWNVDLAPVPHADVVPVAVARALGLPDQPGRSTIETLTRFIGNQRMLVVLDNCEHLLDASASLVTELLGACPDLTLLTTSREPIGVAGEVSWRVPSMSLADDAVELFADRARRVRPDFRVTDDNAKAVSDICGQLDGLPLAIELAAARIRALSLAEIIESLRHRFRLLTGGARMAVRRQQTLHASVDWSHALLTEPDRVLFRRLAVFLGGFDLDAAQFVCGGGDVERYQILDQLTLLVDKSLVVADDDGRQGTRYRLLETMRQYALEKLGESGEADSVRVRHRDHYAAMAAELVATECTDLDARVVRTELEMDNLRIAFGWSLESADLERAQTLASSLQPLWLGRGRILEGRAWFNTAFTQGDPHRLALAPAVHARAKADKAVLDTWIDVAASIEQSQQALAIARGLDDPGLLAHVLTACGIASQAYDADAARPYFAEAMGLARARGESWMLIQILFWQAGMAIIAGDPITARVAAEEGRELADRIGDHFSSRCCRADIGWSMFMCGDVVGAIALFDAVIGECEVNSLLLPNLLQGLACAHAHRGNAVDARVAAAGAIEAGAELGEYFEACGYSALLHASLAAGDVTAALTAAESAWRRIRIQPKSGAVQRGHNAAAALAAGDLVTARSWADEAAPATAGWNLVAALSTRARVAIADGHPDDADRDAHDALSCAATVGAHLSLPDIVECQAELARGGDRNLDAARLFGAAEGMRQRMGTVRFKIYDAGHADSVTALRAALAQEDFDAAWAEGASMSIEEAIAYAQRGRGDRKRPASGWDSLTPAELDVVKLVTEGLTNKDVAVRLFISPRTVQAHLAHVFTKLGVTSRMQLAQEAAGRG
jgi:predicted ATPase/class 3 adenylate cyclase/DNA-binding CsgD family transcriptional regulator